MEKKQIDHQFIYLLPCLLLILVSIWKSYTFPIHDFANYYYGAYAIVQGLFQPDIYDALYFNELLRAKGFNDLFISYYPNTPFLAFSFIPLQLFSWQNAKLLFNIVGSILFLYSLYRGFKYYKISAYYLLLIPILFYVPIKNNILFGQPYFYLFFLLLEGLLCYEKKATVWTALLWGIAILLKVFPILLFFLLLLKKDWKGFLYLGIACTLLLLISVPFCGISTWQYFITDVFPKSSAGIIYDSFTPKAKSAVMLFRNLFVYDEMLNPNPLLNSNFLFKCVLTSYKIIIISICAWVTWSKSYHILTVFAFWMVASLLIGPTSSSYSQLFLLFPFIAILYKAQHVKIAARIFVFIFIFLSCNIPQHHFYELPLYFKFPRLYILILLLGILTFIIRPSINWRILLLFIVLFGSMTYFGNSLQSTNSYVLLEKPYPSIMSNFGEKEGRLWYSYWRAEGEQLQMTKHKINEISSEEVVIKDQQIYYKNQQLTNSLDRKQHARLVDKKEIYYLTDINRGGGFYTLRKISIQALSKK